MEVGRPLKSVMAVRLCLEPPTEREIIMKKSPNEGGCWFCHQDPVEEVLYFSTEFDTYFHEDCLLKELKLGNPEAEIIARELDIGQ